MAYQPKSYRKFLTTSVTAALVATVAAPAIPSVSAASNFNDEIPTWALDAVDYLVGKGAIEGKPGNIFDPHGSLTRGEAAKILALTLGLEVDEDAKTDFADAKDHWASRYIAAIQEQLPGVIDGYTDNTFRPNNTITRQELAKMVVEAYELEKDENVDVSFSDNNGWGKEYVEVLASLGIVQGKRANIFAPNDRVTRAETAVFVHRTEVPSARVTPEETVLRITEVKALDDANRFLQIRFSQRVHSLEPADITIEDAKSKERYGVKEVNLSSNGLVAQVELFAHEGTTQVLKNLTDYNVIVKANGRTLQYVFNRPEFVEQRVVDYDASDREITLLTGSGTLTLKVPSDVEEFDFQSVLGEKVSVWFNKDYEVVDYSIAEESTKYDAIELKRDGDEIKLISEGKSYDITNDRFGGNNSPVKFAFYYNGERIVSGDNTIPSQYLGKKYNFAKVGFDKSGKVEYISVYNLSNFLIVKEVDGNVVVGYQGEGTGGEFDAKDATIIKDNKIISLDDIKQGDVLFFNKDANDGDGFAEVLSNTVEGEIEAVFQNAVRVDGKTYRFAEDEDAAEYDVEYAQGAVYLNEDGETEYVDSDAAEELQAAGPVTLYFDRAGNLVYIAGETAQVERNVVTSILTSNINAYSQGNRDRLEVEAKFSTGEEKLFDVNLKDLKSIIVDGVTYEIDNDATNNKWTATIEDENTDDVHILLKHNAQTNPLQEVKIYLNPENTATEPVKLVAKEDLVKLHLNSDRTRLEKLEFFIDRTVELNTESGDSALEAGDAYAKGKKLSSNTLVFDAKSFKNNAKDISITTWGEYKGRDISKAKVVFDKNNEVIGLVILKTTSDADVYEEAVITEVLRNTDGDVVEITAYVNGEKRTLEVDEVSAPNLKRGSVAVLVFKDKNSNLVENIIESADFGGDQKLGPDYAFLANIIKEKDVNVGKREVTIAGSTYKLATNGLVIDATDKSDIKVKTLADLRGKNNVTVVLDEKDSNFVKFFIINAEFNGQVITNNNPPTVANPIPDVTATVGTAEHINLSTVFDDADGDTLTFTATSSSEDIATVTVSANTLTITPLAEGTSQITVTANDGFGGTVTTKFNVIVEN